ncbi:AMP-binding protein [Hoeflea sp. CAU 1731]
MNVALWLKRAAQLYPHAPALLKGERVVATYEEFYRRAKGLAGALQSQYTIGEGDRVAIFMANSTEYLEVMNAVWIAGATVVPINAKLHPREAAWIIENSGAKLIISAGKDLAGISKEATVAGLPLIDVNSDAYVGFYDADPVAEPLRQRHSNIAWLFYTSGTTGRPKGVMLTHGNMLAMTLTYFSSVDDTSHSDCTLYAAPISHGAGCYSFAFTLRGARHIVPESGGFDPGEIVALAPGLKNICMFAAPTMVRRLVEHAKSVGYDGEGLKTVVYGGGPMYVADIIEAVDVLGPRFVQIYGQGESPMTITALSRELIVDRTHPRWRERLGSVGVAQTSVEVIVADEEGNELPHGVIGEIRVYGTPVMKGYWENEAATRETIRDGWLRTGDLGTMDEDGFVTLHDRSKDMIISGGTNIYPREVEEALLTHPSVAQVSVVGRPDPEWGETVVAFVVAEKGQTLDDAELDRHCLDQIARFKRPKEYVHLPDLPKNAYGKVLKTELRQMLAKDS